MPGSEGLQGERQHFQAGQYLRGDGGARVRRVHVYFEAAKVLVEHFPEEGNLQKLEIL